MALDMFGCRVSVTTGIGMHDTPPPAKVATASACSDVALSITQLELSLFAKPASASR